jgi:hypothetical protein
MFLSFYCDYIVDEFAVFFAFFSNFFVKLLIFDGLSGPPKIRSNIFGRSLFLTARGQAAENRLFSVATCQPPKVNCYFRRLDSGRQKYRLIFG